MLKEPKLNKFTFVVTVILRYNVSFTELMCKKQTSLDNTPQTSGGPNTLNRYEPPQLMCPCAQILTPFSPSHVSRCSCGRFLSNLVLFLVYPCVCCWQFLNRTFAVQPWDRPKPMSGDGLEDETDLDEYDFHLQRQGLLRGSTLVQRQVQLTTTTQANTSGSEELEELSKLSTQTGESDREDEGDRYPGRYSNTEDEAIDTRYVLNVMNESRKSLRAVVCLILKLLLYFGVIASCVLLAL